MFGPPEARALGARSRRIRSKALSILSRGTLSQSLSGHTPFFSYLAGVQVPLKRSRCVNPVSPIADLTTAFISVDPRSLVSCNRLTAPKHLGILMSSPSHIQRLHYRRGSFTRVPVARELSQSHPRRLGLF